MCDISGVARSFKRGHKQEPNIFQSLSNINLILSKKRSQRRKGHGTLWQLQTDISALPIWEKIFEKYFHKQISAYLLKNKLIAPHQYGF